MGNDRSKRVVERVAAAFARLGGDSQERRNERRGRTSNDERSEESPESGVYWRDSTESSASSTGESEPDAPSTSSGTDEQGAARAVTDGGADEASSGESPWIEDDPIVFGEETESDSGTALLDAVTESEASAPPFGEESVAGTAEPDPTGQDPNGIDPERLDELEARIEALESDHVQLESSITDVASSVADLRTDVETIGADVRELVAVLGGIAIAADRSDVADPALEPSESIDSNGLEDTTDEPDSAEELDSAEPRDTAESPDSADGATADERDESTVPVDDEPNADSGDPDVDSGEQGADSDEPDADGTDPDRTHADRDGGDSGRESVTTDRESVDANRAENATDDAPDANDDRVPEGIRRGAGDPPSATQASDSATADSASIDSAAPTAATDSATAESAAEDVAPEREEAPAEEATPSDRSDEPARELVDPRTEAVGARLRQFREGFADDPTADLPTGNAADEFRFEKILLPTDGEAAPDISAGELEKPYLESLPDGYAADAVVLEWLDWLVSAADGAATAQAVAYYESIEWLTADVRDDLLGYLEGLDETGATAGAAGTTGGEASIGEPPAALDLQDHLRSLQYVTELASGEVGTDGV